MKNPRMFRCRLQDAYGNRLTYIGPYESIPKGWSMFMRVSTGPRGGIAA